MKIYEVHNGVLVSADVVRETPCYYYIADHLPGTYYTKRFRKEHTCITEEEAIQEEYNFTRERFLIFKKRADKEKDRLEKAKELMASIGLNVAECGCRYAK